MGQGWVYGYQVGYEQSLNRVEWRFLEAIMGFGDRWIGLIMMCVTRANYAILVNGTPIGQIFPTQGLK
jgi:hypothetical protein